MPQSSLRAVCTALMAALVAVFGCHDYSIDFSETGDEIRIFDDLYSVSMVDEKHAVAVGYYGAAYWTEDGGDHWRSGQTSTRSSLYNVSMADPKHGWAVGQRGLILRTEDGGRSWTIQDNLKRREGTHLFAVTAIDADTAWVVGEWGTRIRTRDGGGTWEDHSFRVTEFHPQFVWLTPEEQERVRTGQVVYDDVSVNDIHCERAPGSKCWLIGEFGYIYYSLDRGETWLKSRVEGSVEMDPIPIAYNALEVPSEYMKVLRDFAHQVKDDSHLNVAVAGLVSVDEIRDFGDEEDPSELFEILEARAQDARSILEDAGVSSDRVRFRGQPPWDFEDYLEDDPQFLSRYLEGRLNETGGVQVNVLQNPILFTVRFADPDHGLISGLGGVILQSVDGGESWEYRKIDRKQALFSVRSVPGRAIAIGEKGLMRISIDRGDSWGMPQPEAIPAIYTFMRDVDFAPSGSKGLIVGQGGRILRSTDAGYEWTQVLPPIADAAAESS
ncbi:MAG: hypothetical protein GY944_25275 [bacterium]|nr:hypothetical protein [bacterium]